MSVIRYKGMVPVWGLLGILAAGAASAGELGVAYLRTLGQSNVTGPPIATLGGRAALDETGHLYCGTPAGGSTLQKLAPDGRIVWSQFLNVPGFQAAAVDDSYLYTCGTGYYGIRHLRRWERAGGKPVEGWSLEWNNPTNHVNGVRPLLEPVALLANAKHLYVADRQAHELRRFDKATGTEAPFGKRVMVVEPVDLAFGDNGRLLILTPDSVLETDLEGRPTRVPLIGGLRGAVALDCVPATRRILIAEGGTPQKPVNLVRTFDADGKPAGADIGVGGEFSGAWTSLGFAFSGGSGDVLADGKGGLWINPGWSHKLGMMPVLTHVGPDGKPGRVLRASVGHGLAADEALGLYVGGQYKLSAEGEILWTSGLIPSATGLFPGTHPHWFDYPALCAGRLYLANHASRAVLAIDRATGAQLLPPQAIPGSGHLLQPHAVKDRLIVGDSSGALWRMDPELKAAPEKVFQAPADWKVATLVPDAELKSVFVGRAGTPNLLCRVKLDGTVLWEREGAAPAAHDNGLLFVPLRSGLQVCLAETGLPLAVIDADETDGRPPLTDIQGVAVSGTGPDVTLAVLGNRQIRLYRLRRP